MAEHWDAFKPVAYGRALGACYVLFLSVRPLINRLNTARSLESPRNVQMLALYVVTETRNGTKRKGVPGLQFALRNNTRVMEAVNATEAVIIAAHAPQNQGLT